MSKPPNIPAVRSPHPQFVDKSVKINGRSHKRFARAENRKGANRRNPQNWIIMSPIKCPIFQNRNRRDRFAPRKAHMCDGADALGNGQLDDRVEDLRSWRRSHDNAKRGARGSVDYSSTPDLYIHEFFPFSAPNSGPWRFLYKVRLLFVTKWALVATVAVSGRKYFFPKCRRTSYSHFF